MNKEGQRVIDMQSYLLSDHMPTVDGAENMIGWIFFFMIFIQFISVTYKMKLGRIEEDKKYLEMLDRQGKK